MLGLRITRSQAKYFVFSALILYVLAFVITYLVSSWFSSNPYASNLNTYDLLSGIPSTVFPLASAFLLAYSFSAFSLRLMGYALLLDAPLTALSYYLYHIQFSANPYIYLIPDGRTYVYTDYRFTLFAIFASFLIYGTIIFILRLRDARKKRTIHNLASQ